MQTTIFHIKNNCLWVYITFINLSLFIYCCMTTLSHTAHIKMNTVHTGCRLKHYSVPYFGGLLGMPLFLETKILEIAHGDQ